MTVKLTAVAVLATLAAGCGSTATPSNTGTPAPEPGSFAQLRTAWGDPDLQGVWRYEAVVPLERPKELEGREALTPEEMAQK